MVRSMQEIRRRGPYHRRARLEAVLGEALDEVDRQIEEMQADRA